MSKDLKTTIYSLIIMGILMSPFYFVGEIYEKVDIQLFKTNPYLVVYVLVSCVIMLILNFTMLWIAIRSIYED